MSGVAVVLNLLLADSAVVAAVGSADQIMAGEIPLNTPLPAIGVSHTSGMPRNTLSMLEPGRLVTERVQVTVLVKTQTGQPAGTGYPGMVALLALVLAACGNRYGTVAGVSVRSILPDVEGPDLPYPEEGIIGRSRDFMVSRLT